MPAPVLHAPPSKSLTHRALLLGALSSVPCVVRNAGLGADNRATLDVLRAWGARAEVDEEGGTVRFEPFEPTAPAAALDCGNSGTTLRFLAGQAARFSFASTLTGDASLRTRPNGPLLAVLEQLGATVSSDAARAPLTIAGPIAAADVSLRGGLSSQFASSILLALAQTRGRSTVRLLPPVASRPYLDLTFIAADAFGLGLDVQEDEGGLRVGVPGGRRPAASEFTVEGDWSGGGVPRGGRPPRGGGGGAGARPARWRGCCRCSMIGTCWCASPRPTAWPTWEPCRPFQPCAPWRTAPGRTRSARPTKRP